LVPSPSRTFGKMLSTRDALSFARKAHKSAAHFRFQKEAEAWCPGGPGGHGAAPSNVAFAGECRSPPMPSEQMYDMHAARPGFPDTPSSSSATSGMMLNLSAPQPPGLAAPLPGHLVLPPPPALPSWLQPGSAAELLRQLPEDHASVAHPAPSYSPRHSLWNSEGKAPESSQASTADTAEAGRQRNDSFASSPELELALPFYRVRRKSSTGTDMALQAALPSSPIGGRDVAGTDMALQALRELDHPSSTFFQGLREDASKAVACIQSVEASKRAQVLFLAHALAVDATAAAAAAKRSKGRQTKRDQAQNLQPRPIRPCGLLEPYEAVLPYGPQAPTMPCQKEQLQRRPPMAGTAHLQTQNIACQAEHLKRRPAARKAKQHCR